MLDWYLSLSLLGAWPSQLGWADCLEVGYALSVPIEDTVHWGLSFSFNQKTTVRRGREVTSVCVPSGGRKACA